jgi:hypothetical protein
MKIIFLDFDGVLAPYGNRYEAGKFSKSCVENFNKILKFHPEAKIVVSSSWRRHGVKYVKDMLDANGIDSSKVRGITPEEKGPTREHHIKEYLSAHTDIDEFVIIDDDHMDILKKNSVRPNQHIGLTEADSKNAIDILS